MASEYPFTDLQLKVRETRKKMAVMRDEIWRLVEVGVPMDAVEREVSGTDRWEWSLV